MNEDKEKPVVIEPIIEATKTESDAVHPRFIEQNPEEVLKYEQENHYYCRECLLYFAPTYDGLRNHFDKEITTHKPIGSCFYCKGKVYEYCKRGQSRLYHNCKSKSRTETNNQ